MTKVYSEKYNALLLRGGKLHAFTGFFKNEDITSEVEFVKIWEVNKNSSAFNFYHNSIVGGLLGGLVGVVTLGLMSNRTAGVKCSIFLKDKNYFTIDTEDGKLIDFLIPYTFPGKKYQVEGKEI